MLDHASIKKLAKETGLTAPRLLALTRTNDPFYAGLGYRKEAGEWFATLWRKYGLHSHNLRRIHYRLVSQSRGAVLRPNGNQYENTETDWAYLIVASLAARYLDLIPFDSIIDQRNDPPIFNAINAHLDPDEDREVSCEVQFDEVEIETPGFPTLPLIDVIGLDDDAVRQDYIVEVWIEKSTQNDWLVPLCERRGVNLQIGVGERSETRCRELALRSAKYAVPVRVIYISDFDPGGRSMPKAVARKVEFTLMKLGLEAGLKLIPLALTEEQCRHYRLPRTPIKKSERRKGKFEERYGEGATELDALEALHPGELARLLEAEINNFLDAGLASRVRRAYHDQMLPLNVIELKVRTAHLEEIEKIEERFERIESELDELKDEASDLWRTMADEMEEKLPDLSDVEIPRSEASGETDSLVLFDSERDYFTQMDFYNAWKDGDENDESDYEA
jgi:hypothetical protein